MKSFDVRLTIVTGVATNTLGGIGLIKKLCGLDVINFIDPKTHPDLVDILESRLFVESDQMTR